MEAEWYCKPHRGCREGWYRLVHTRAAHIMTMCGNLVSHTGRAPDDDNEAWPWPPKVLEVVDACVRTA